MHKVQLTAIVKLPGDAVDWELTIIGDRGSRMIFAHAGGIDDDAALGQARDVFIVHPWIIITNVIDLDIGAIVVATGSNAHHPGVFGYGRNPAVITNLELERRLHTEKVDADHITFIGCIGSRQENMGCSRYCCTSMIAQALQLVHAIYRSAAEGREISVEAGR